MARFQSSSTLLAALLASSSPWSAVEAQSVSCPAPGADPQIISATGVLTLELSSADQVCMLQRITTETDPDDGSVTQSFAPAGRSYNGGDWQSVAGPYITEIQFDCTAGTSCSTMSALPTLESNEEFVLVAAEHSLTEEQEIARFLEQTTFGTTRALLNGWIDAGGLSSKSFKDAVTEELNSSVMTEHRSYYRTRTNARATLLKDTETGVTDKPCDANSRWRRYAFAWEEDKYDQKVLFEPIDADTFLVKVDGIPRTEVPVAAYTPEGIPASGGEYELCSSPGEYVGGKLRVRVGSSCKTVDIGGNPEIKFEKSTAPSIVTETLALTFLDPNDTDENDGILTAAITGSNAVCDSLPIDGGVPVFAKTSAGVWYMHDPRILLRDNTLTNVLSDGGASAVANGITQCSNAPRTFLNKDQCIVAPAGCTVDVASAANVVVCGSPGEVKSDVTVNHGYDMSMDSDEDNSGFFERQRQDVWMAAILDAPDQLRQRMAWALSQIMPMVPKDINAEDETEPYLVYYDILVRNAFGNYRDILKEVSYSPMMAEMLTYHESKSMAYMQDEQSEENIFPDENYSREVMQLFSIGLNQMNMDGTLKIDPVTGEAPFTYDNYDIMDGARIWTGFDRQLSRGNAEDRSHKDNRIDPMAIEGIWHDAYPKMGLDKNYLGDKIPLCVDAPDQEFLKMGATYRMLGSNSLPELQEDDPDWVTDSRVVRVVLKQTSELYNALCNDGGSGCDLTQMEVTLSSNLSCGTDPEDIQCKIDQPRVVELEGQNLFFEYIKPACVQFPFFENGKKVKTRSTNSDAMCADPLLSVATEMCCTAGKTYNWLGDRACLYTGERTTFATAEARCAAIGYNTCTWRSASYIRSDGSARGLCGLNDNCCLYRDNFMWSTTPCETTIKINPIEGDGQIAIVHNHTEWDDGKNQWRGEIKPSLKPTNINYFRVKWATGDELKLPTDETTCGGDCQWDSTLTTPACFCPFTLSESAVFATQPSYEDAMDQLMIGGINPTAKGCTAGTPTGSGNTVTAWDCSSSGGVLDKDTVFELTDSATSKVTYLKNAVSTVSINTGDAAGPLSFRNPPHYVSMVEQDVRDIEREVDAALDQMFYNANTAPFISKRLIQRFGFSNPSPVYVEAVSTAFVNGMYDGIGEGEYGCLKATLAAILLHPEARSPVLDADPSFGSLREPLIKLLHLMRAMEFTTDLNDIHEKFEVRYISERIGEMAHAQPHVFSYFLPDFIPPGRLNKASLVSPESQVTNTPTVLGLLEGMFSLIKFGLSECYGGFGGDTDYSCSDWDETETAESPKALGRLTYTPTPGRNMMEEIALLLTSGRLTLNTPDVLHYMYELGLGRPDDMGMMRVVQQLVVTSPEFNANGLTKRLLTGNALRPPLPAPVPSNKDHKSIIFLFMAGGMDSYNLVVPDEADAACTDMSTMYKETRGEAVALTGNELGGPIAATSQATCQSYRFHKELSFVEQMYNAGDAAILANTGILFEPVTLDTWKSAHAKTNLFAHDVQQRETKFIDPFQDNAGTGVLGRMTDELRRLSVDPFNTGQISLEKTAEPIDGSGDGFVTFVSGDDVAPFDITKSVPRLHQGIERVNNMTDYDLSNVYGELWSKRTYQALQENEAFVEAMSGITLDGPSFDTEVGGGTAKGLQQIARLIKAKTERGTDRDVFYLQKGGWDTHDDVKPRVSANFASLNSALADFKNEMTLQGKWNDVLIVISSEFGRTLSGNSGEGTDHAWAGNYLLLGGDVKGGQMHGTYPEDYETVSVGRTRLHPTTPWEGVWKPIAEWFGVPQGKLNAVLPNLPAFSGSPEMMIAKEDMFDSLTSSTRNLRKKDNY